MNNNHIAFTIIAENYLAFALTLKQSFEKQNPNIEFKIIIADGISENNSKFSAENKLTLIDALTIEPQKFTKMAFYYDITEYCTSIKPFIMKHFLSQGYKTVTYIDPDIYFYHNLYDNVLIHLENNSIFLTPHICSPIKDSCLPSEQTHLLSGTYNLGFISISNDSNAEEFIEWWISKCQLECFDEQQSGLFVDQKWINLVPGLFQGVYISRHLGLNVAYWNIHEREISTSNLVNNEYELVFYHFSGIKFNDLNLISKHQNRFTLDSRKDLSFLFSQYKTEVERNLDALPTLPAYKFSNYLNGMRISLLARRAYFLVRDSYECPFNSNESQTAFLNYLKTLNIKEKKYSDEIVSKSEINKNINRLSKVMKCILKIIGPYKYISLMKAFRYLSGLSNCDFLYKNNNHSK